MGDGLRLACRCGEELHDVVSRSGSACVGMVWSVGLVGYGALAAWMVGVIRPGVVRVALVCQWDSGRHGVVCAGLGSRCGRVWHGVSWRAGKSLPGLKRHVVGGRLGETSDGLSR